MADKPKFNPRQMMEKTIEVMRRSVGESRDDGKPNPLVGAVLVRPDGSTETASRGELRDGNHAEFTLLERKCIGEKLDDCVLFATLEPCLNRNHPKRGLAEDVRESLSKAQAKGWEWISQRESTTSGQLAAQLEVDKRTARRYLEKFVELGLLKAVGEARARKYRTPGNE